MSLRHDTTNFVIFVVVFSLCCSVRTACLVLTVGALTIFEGQVVDHTFTKEARHIQVTNIHDL